MFDQIKKKCTKELDNASFFAQVIHKNISEEDNTTTIYTRDGWKY